MIKIIQWLGRNKLVAVLLGIAVYFSIVTFHDEITDLAIWMRNAIGRDKYNEFLAYGFLVLLLIFILLTCYHALRGRQRYLKLALSAVLTALMVLSFRFLMVYNIEAIHFAEYMLLAIILLPVIRSYGETVFWITILGALDELFQYIFLVPTFEYFDFNDIILNLLGAGAGAVLVFVFNDNAIEVRPFYWHKSPALLTGLGLLAIFFILFLSGRMTMNPLDTPGSENWFSLNRESLPDGFWKEAYPGRRFHILRPFEGILLMYLLFAGFWLLDLFTLKSHVKYL
jgi:VanZ family protein